MIIGVFDSGVGGLWVLKYIREQFSQYDYIYFGDQIHIPYGSKSISQIRDFSEEITSFLISKGCQLIVIACNTASASSLDYLRNKFPDTLFIGIEPAVKPASEKSQTKKIGVLATSTTLQGSFYHSLVGRFNNQVKIFENSCSGLVEQIEDNQLDSEKTVAILNEALLPMIKENIDTIVLGCTHYPFVASEIRKIVGDKINIIDPTKSIVQQVGRILENNNLIDTSLLKGNLKIFTTGSVDKIKLFLSKIEILNTDNKIKVVNWGNNIKLSEKKL